MTEHIISIKDLHYRYRGEKEFALQGISLKVNKGEFVVVMGPSEAGKSTMSACLNGLIPHFHKGTFKGEVIIKDKNTNTCTVAQMAELVGLVFQDFEAQLFSTNVELEVAFGPENFAVPRNEIAGRIKENLAYVGLEALRNQSSSILSGGQKQKLAIASVLAMHPQVLVMDEPTTDLDPMSKAAVFEIADRLRQRDDLTLVVVEHEAEEALHADRILLLKDGQIVCFGPVEELLRKVDLLEELGIMPLGVPKFFKKMGSDRLPLRPQEGVQTFRENGWSLSNEKYAKLADKDDERNRHFGQVLIRAVGVEHSYPNGFQALKGIDLEIRQAEMVAIVGQNGSGKTTLVKHFNGLLMPTRGTMEVAGHTTKEQGVFLIGQKVGYVFQNPDHQIFSETVFDEVAFSLRLRKFNKREIKRLVGEALEAVGLAGCEKADPFSMTKSGRQRVAVASVLADRPDVMILDEPTTGLDYSEQRSMMNLLKHLNEKGSTIIFITHHMWVVAEYAQRLYVIKDGRIFLQGTTREVFSHEAKLREAYLRPPHVVSFSNLLGKTLLTTDELLFCTEKG